MEQLHGGAEGDEFVFGGTQHISDEQAEGRSDAFASCSQQMFQRRTQVGMLVFPSLFPNPLFNELKLILYRSEKSSRAQTLASPTEQTISVCRGDLGDLFAGCHVNFCNFISNMRYECRFVAFAALRDRGKEGRVGFDEQPIER